MTDRHHETTHVHVTLDLAGLAPIVTALIGQRPVLQQIVGLLQELKTMSQTTSQMLDTGLAAIGTALDELSADMTAIAAEVTTLVAGLTPGTAVTQAQVDSANALAARVTALDQAAKAVVAQAPGTATHVAADPNETAANGSLMNDGTTTRNNFSLPNFNPNAAETA